VLHRFEVHHVTHLIFSKMHVAAVHVLLIRAMSSALPTLLRWTIETIWVNRPSSISRPTRRLAWSPSATLVSMSASFFW
jgi:hypothetical protein